jgi:hypothetical protein
MRPQNNKPGYAKWFLHDTILFLLLSTTIFIAVIFSVQSRRGRQPGRHHRPDRARRPPETRLPPPQGNPLAHLDASDVQQCQICRVSKRFAEQIRTNGARFIFNQLSANVVNRFNALIDDYINRCSSFR